ncbi:glycosyltransferase family 2 protein [bacterium]|nr:glycosyltransferase family 2 protein [bacterium]
MTQTDHYQLSLIIVNWNTKDMLLACLASLVAQLGSEAFECIVVDNASQDGSVAAVAEQYPAVKVIANQSNRGFAAATNQGIAIATAPLVGLLNPDTQIKEDALTFMIRAMLVDETLLAVGPQLLNSDGSLQPSGRRFPGFFRTLLEGLLPEFVKQSRGWRKAAFGRTDFYQPAKVDELSGACFITRREVLDKIGLLDEGYFIYFEEIDWFRRLRKIPGYVLYQPAAQVVHHWAASLSQCGDQAWRWHYDALFRYWRKHHGWFWTVGIRKVVFFHALVWSLVQLLKTVFFHSAWRSLPGKLKRNGLIMRMALKGGEGTA